MFEIDAGTETLIMFLLIPLGAAGIAFMLTVGYFSKWINGIPSRLVRSIVSVSLYSVLTIASAVVMYSIGGLLYSTPKGSAVVGGMIMMFFGPLLILGDFILWVTLFILVVIRYFKQPDVQVNVRDSSKKWWAILLVIVLGLAAFFFIIKPLLIDTVVREFLFKN